MHKLAIAVNPFFKSNLRIAAYAHHDKTYQLWKFLYIHSKKHFIKRVIAHNPGAFYPAIRFYNKTGIAYQIDVEDYHPGEIPYFNTKHEKRNRIVLIKAAMEKAKHITYAAPLIMKECIKLVGDKTEIISKSFVVNNCFSKDEFKLETQSSKRVKLVWFSQNISKGRGLEQLLPVLNEFSEQIELHLIGNLYKDFEDEYIKLYQSFIKTHSPLPQKSLNLKLAEFDIGLALETESKDYNRQICLTNKIWSYLQSGLFIFATNTPAQKVFLETHKNCGTLISSNQKRIKKDIGEMIANIEGIRSQKASRFNYSRKFSWEKEQQKLKQILAQ